jgi:hypothetical protein
MPGQLNEDQIRRATEVLHEYLSAPAGPDGRPPFEVQLERDESKRAARGLRLIILPDFSCQL